ncbi:MAG: hypothetical protein ACXWRE_04655 [Pseudobdellovibrionaceae bacterium]
MKFNSALTNYWKGFILALFCITGSPALAAPAPAQAPAEAYSAGAEFMKQILSSIRKDKFNLYLNFDLTLSPDKKTPPRMNVFEMQAMMLFKNNSEGITIPFSAPNPHASETERKLAIKNQLDLSNKYGLIHLSKGEVENELVGDFRFYSKNATTGKLIADHVKLDVNSELLDFKSLYLYGAKIKIQLAGAHSSKEEIKQGLIKALLTCDAETDFLDMLSDKITRQPLQKCSFNFDGKELTIQYQDPKLNYFN